MWDPITVFTGLLVLIGAAQGVIFVLQLAVFRRQLDFIKSSAADSRRALDSAEASATAAKEAAQIAKSALGGDRAWMILEYFGSASKPGTIVPQRSYLQPFKFTFRNYGKTPAMRPRIFATYYAVPTGRELDIPQTFDNADDRQVPIAPDHSLDSTWFKVPAVSEGRMFVFGRIEYFDIFDASTMRVTEVCLSIEGALRQAETELTFFEPPRPYGPRNTAT